MKKILLKIWLKIQLQIVNGRIYFLENDLEFCLFDEDKEIIREKLNDLYDKYATLELLIRML